MRIQAARQNEAACDSFVSLIISHLAASTQTLTPQKAFRFVKMANNVGMQEWFNRHIPKDKWPSLLGSDNLCSAVVNGKGEDLMRFLAEAQIAKDKWPSLLGIGSLCSSIQRGKGPSLLVCLEQNRVPIEKRHTVLSNNSLCSAIASGKCVDLTPFLT
jgi:hypothetical protein